MVLVPGAQLQSIALHKVYVFNPEEKTYNVDLE